MQADEIYAILKRQIGRGAIDKQIDELRKDVDNLMDGRIVYKEQADVEYVFGAYPTKFAYGFDVGDSVSVLVNGEPITAIAQADPTYAFPYIGSVSPSQIIEEGVEGWAIMSDGGGSCIGVAFPDATVTVNTILKHKITEDFMPTGYVRTLNEYVYGSGKLEGGRYNEKGESVLIYIFEHVTFQRSHTSMADLYVSASGNVSIGQVHGSLRENAIFVNEYNFSHNYTGDARLFVQKKVYATTLEDAIACAEKYGYTLTSKPTV